MGHPLNHALEGEGLGTSPTCHARVSYQQFPDSDASLPHCPSTFLQVTAPSRCRMCWILLPRHPPQTPPLCRSAEHLSNPPRDTSGRHLQVEVDGKPGTVLKISASDALTGRTHVGRWGGVFVARSRGGWLVTTHSAGRLADSSGPAAAGALVPNERTGVVKLN